jgi:Recombinase
MPHKERVREPLTELPTREYLLRRIELGWRPTAIEWERDIHEEGSEAAFSEEIPYGLKVSSDCAGLVENPFEREVITAAIDMIVEDRPLSSVASELNRRGYKTRAGHEWTPGDLFMLLPRMIQIGPKLFSSDQWMHRRERLPRLV